MEQDIITSEEFPQYMHDSKKRNKGQDIKRVVVLRDSTTGETIMGVSDNSAKRIRDISRSENKNFNQLFSGDVKHPKAVRHELYERFKQYKSISGRKHRYILSDKQYEELIEELKGICVLPSKYEVIRDEDGKLKAKESVIINHFWAE